MHIGREPDAQFMLGFFYCGFGCTDEGAAVFDFHPEKGMRLLRSAAEHKYIPACIELARLLFYGSDNFDVVCDPAESFRLLHDVENVDDPRAYSDLASMYEATKNTYRKIMCLRKASDLGDGTARKEMGHLYWGSGLISKAEIREYFSFAAQNSPPHCQASCHYHIANLYKEEGDTQQYMAWLKKAAELNHSEAAYLYGSYLLVGAYCQKDQISGGQWLDQARYLGHPDANFVFLRNFGVRLEVHLHDIASDYVIIMQVAALEHSTVTDVKSAISKQIWPSGAPAGHDVAPRGSSHELLFEGKRLADCSISHGAELTAFVNVSEKRQGMQEESDSRTEPDVTEIAGAVVLSSQERRYAANVVL